MTRSKLPLSGRHVLLSAALCAVVAGCAARGTGGPVVLADTWPESPGNYADVHRAWTRSAAIRDGYQQVLEVFATFKSPAWRAAYVERTAKTQLLSPAARERLRAAQEEADKAAYEMYLLVTTHDANENDLQKGERSMWRLALVDSQGNEVEPMSVERDRRPRDVVRAEFPDLGDFAVPYVVRFPRTIQALGPDSTRVSLKMASPRGAVEMIWSSR